MGLFQILEDEENTAPAGCQGLAPIVRVIKNGVFPIIQIGIPILLIIMGTVDLGKAVISSDDKEIKAAQGRLIKRCIYAVAVFFIVFLVNLVMSLVSKAEDENVSGSTSWYSCWNEV